MLSISDRCPQAVGDKARELHQAHADSPIAVAVIQRLTADPKMERVWKELAKQRRKKHQRTGRPHHELTEKFAPIGYDKAVTGLLEHAFNLGRLTLMLPSPDQPMRPFEALAKEIRDRAKRLKGRDQASQIIRRRLQAEADAYERVTVAAYDPAEAIAGEIAFCLQSVFGRSMYGVTAAITNVITEQNITDLMVRNWTRRAARRSSKLDPAKNCTI